MKHLRDTSLHFVGIGGIGMSGIAEVFHYYGCRVSGSDVKASPTTERLQKLGIRVSIGHTKTNIGDAHVVVVSSAVQKENVEIQAALEQGIPTIPRAEMLGELMRGKIGIAVAGSHGKTTTTSILASILSKSTLDPTVVIGGVVNAFGTNAKLGQGPIVLVEADESDGSFLHLPAQLCVVTNVDNDHLDHYGSLDAIDQGFGHFVSKIPFFGHAFVCLDDVGVRRCLKRFKKPYVTYGFSKEARLRISSIAERGESSRFTVSWDDDHVGEFEIGVPGRHNLLNALAAIGVALELDVPVEVIQAGIREYRGVKRRFEKRFEDHEKKMVIIDDYGHHPTEIRATLHAARRSWQGRVVCVFQPHRFSRTLNCMDGFLRAFEDADAVYITDIYAAGEAPIPGVSAESLVSAIRSSIGNEECRVEYIGPVESCASKLSKEFRPGDMWVCMGAGSITQLPDQLVKVWIG